MPPEDPEPDDPLDDPDDPKPPDEPDELDEPPVALDEPPVEPDEPLLPVCPLPLEPDIPPLELLDEPGEPLIPPPDPLDELDEPLMPPLEPLLELPGELEPDLLPLCDDDPGEPDIPGSVELLDDEPLFPVVDCPSPCDEPARSGLEPAAEPLNPSLLLPDVPEVFWSRSAIMQYLPSQWTSLGAERVAPPRALPSVLCKLA